MTKSELLDRLSVLFGGRVAEEIILGEISTGAHNDLQQATGIATSMVKEYGMSENLGHVTFEKEKRPFFLPSSIVSSKEYSEDRAKQIDAEVKKIIDETYQKVKGILDSKKEKLEALARLLLEKEVVEEADLKKIVQSPPISRCPAPIRPPMPFMQPLKITYKRKGLGEDQNDE